MTGITQSFQKMEPSSMTGMLKFMLVEREIEPSL